MEIVLKIHPSGPLAAINGKLRSREISIIYPEKYVLVIILGNV